MNVICRKSYGCLTVVSAKAASLRQRLPEANTLRAGYGRARRDSARGATGPGEWLNRLQPRNAGPSKSLRQHAHLYLLFFPESA